MTPAEYLSELQAPYRFYPYLFDIRDRLVKFLGGERPEPLRVPSDESWVARNHAFLLERLPEWVTAHLSPDRLAVGELKTASVNASAMPVPDRDDAWVIALQTGLSLLMYKCARAVFATFTINDSSPTLTTTEAGSILGEYLSHYGEVGVAFGPEFECSAPQRMLASKVATAAERFVHCHEISHVVLGHLSRQRR